MRTYTTVPEFLGAVLVLLAIVAAIAAFIVTLIGALFWNAAVTVTLGILALACGVQLVCIVRDGIRPCWRAWRGRMPQPTGVVYLPRYADDIPFGVSP